MTEFQLSALVNPQRFEHLICDLFNKIENDNFYTINIGFQTFGVTGQQQKGIDIISQKAGTIIQCKVRRQGKDDAIRSKFEYSGNHLTTLERNSGNCLTRGIPGTV